MPTNPHDDEDDDTLRAPVDDHLPPRLQPSRHHQRRGHGGFWLFLLLIVFIGFGAWGIISRMGDSHELKQKTNQEDTLVVNVTQPKLQPAAAEIILPGNVRAWHEASLSARVPGYLKSWNKDIGEHVKSGELLASIDTPETDAQLHQAQANLQLAIANNNLAQVTAQRWIELRKTDSVTQQETDQNVADAAAKAAAVQAQQATVDQFQSEESFKNLIAPFDGVVTNRATDIGQLISANGAELYHIVTIDKLRVYINLPENYVTYLTPLLTAQLHFNEHPDQTFDAHLIDTAKAIDPATRTLLVQFAMDNENADVFPGGYCEVHIKVPSTETTMRLPVNAVLFQSQGLQVATVGSDNKIAIKTVKPGRDFGTDIEILAGITPDDRIVLNPPDSIFGGETVKVAPPPKENGGQEQQQATDEHKNDPSDTDKSQAKKGDDNQKDPQKAHGEDQSGHSQ